MSGEDHWRAVTHFVLLPSLRSPTSSALMTITFATVVLPKKTEIKKGKWCNVLTFLGYRRVCFLSVQLSHPGQCIKYFMCLISRAVNKWQWTNVALGWTLFLSLLELTFAWIFNEYPHFVQQDSRRFISQATGSLYIAKVEPSDVGNYTCVVTNTVTKTRVQGPPTPLVLRSDGEP